ncbi:MAG: glycosyltransferase [Bacteroidota bacterium]
MRKILFIGPLPDLKNGKIGGARVSFALLKDYVTSRYTEHDFINIDQHGRTKLGYVKNLIYVLASFLKRIKNVDVVMLNFSQKGAIYLAPVLFFLAKARSKKVVFRMFGGSMQEIFQSRKWIRWLWKKTILRSDILVLQTKSLINYFSNYSNDIYWLPTSRKSQISTDEIHKSFRKRFVFVSQVKEAKGVSLILEAARHFDAEYTFDIYGPVHENHYLEDAKFNACYKGALKPEDVLPTLAKYDVLLLPTHYPGEGYPGIIIEAYSMGLPVITTSWLYIPEIVEDGRTGMLINPKDAKALIQAIQSFDETNYGAFSMRARNKYDEFDADVINEKLLNKLYAL